MVDREAHRIQLFDPEGNFLTMWNNIHRPDAMVLRHGHIYVGELNGMGGVDDAPAWDTGSASTTWKGTWSPVSVTLKRGRSSTSS